MGAHVCGEVLSSGVGPKKVPDSSSRGVSRDFEGMPPGWPLGTAKELTADL